MAALHGPLHEAVHLIGRQEIWSSPLPLALGVEGIKGDHKPEGLWKIFICQSGLLGRVCQSTAVSLKVPMGNRWHSHGLTKESLIKGFFFKCGKIRTTLKPCLSLSPTLATLLRRRSPGVKGIKTILQTPMPSTFLSTSWFIPWFLRVEGTTCV